MRLFTKKKMADSTKKTLTPFGIISLLVLLLYAVSLLLPLLWAFVTSFRDNFDFIMNGAWKWPEKWINNYETVLKYFHVKVNTADGLSKRFVEIPEMLLNTVLYAGGGSFFLMLSSLLMAYAASRFKFKACSVIYTAVILQMIIPIVGSLASEIKMARALGLYDNIPGMWLMKCYVQGLYFLVFHGAFKLIPKEYSEAAEIDGAGNFSIMVRIMFPFVSGTIFSVLLLNFISLWNDYQTPLIYMPSHPTLSFGLYYYVRGSFEAETADTPHQLAGCMLMAIPLFLIFIVFQKRLLGNLSMGGLK